MNKALDYLREYIGRDEVKMATDRAYLHREPLYQVAPCLCDDVQDLLEEYGDDRELPEGWWLEYGEIEDWIEQLY